MEQNLDLKRNIWTYVEEKMIEAIGKLVPQTKDENYEEYEMRIVHTADKALEAMCEVLGGGEYYVPKLPKILRFRRNIRIKFCYTGNISQLANCEDLSQRHIRRVCCEQRQN